MSAVSFPWCQLLDDGWLENTISSKRFWILKSDDIAKIATIRPAAFIKSICP